jgi:hypothetical protein
MKIQQGERMRLGYGFAWRNYETFTTEAYLIPFNFIFRWARELYIFLAKPRWSKRDYIYHDGYYNGYKSAKNYYELEIKRRDEEWSRTVGLAILEERKLKN